MDFLIELVGEILEEGLSWLSSSEKVSKPIRYCIVSVMHLALLVLFGALAFSAEVQWGRFLCGILTGLILVSWFFVIRKIKNAR